ncbi:hypothetical protein [Pseudofrankia sp. DC12]|uniref:hypothetical protein n=1 Tax=Pseudofrankia sp. DC12 TaxID=683315 RepID=UPI0005F7B93A|nr:hypothetical protein [Pseudofrankia sp. DC12]
MALVAGCGRVDPNEGFPGFQDTLAPSAQTAGGDDPALTDAGAGQPTDAADVGAPLAVATPDPQTVRPAGSNASAGTAATASAKASPSGTAGNHAPTAPASTSSIKLPVETTTPAAKPTTARPTGGLTLPN